LASILFYTINHSAHDSCAITPIESGDSTICERVSRYDQNKKGGSPVLSRIKTVSTCVLFLFVAALAATAISGEAVQPSGRVTISSRSIAAGIGVTWGDGKLTFKGKDYPFSIDGLSLVDWGISRASASGEVYNLTDVAKFAGTYVAAEAGLTLAGGMSGMILRNQDGVLIRIRATSRGARLQLGTSGLTIRLK
jgi:hypothetical protein